MKIKKKGICNWQKMYVLQILQCITLIYCFCFTLNYCSGIGFAADAVATVTNLRVSVNDNKVRVVADADSEVDYQSFALTSPNRIIIDLNDAKLAKKVSREIKVNSDYVKKVRIGQFKPNIVRIVVESDVNKNNYDVFGVVGNDGSYRVAMDFGNISYSNSNSSGSKYSTSTNTNTISSDKTSDNTNQTSDNSSSNNNNSYNSNTDVIIDDDTKSILKNKRITLDPGHGGSDSGAIGPTGLYEKTATLNISINVADMLKQAGAKVYITRRVDEDVAPQPASDVEELQARCDVGNKSNSDIFVSVHLDSFSSASAGGTTGYYYVNGSANSQRLANDVKEGIIEQIGTFDRGTKTCNFYVVKHTDMPATLVEVAFISNPEEEAVMKSEEGQKKIAQGIFNGIVRYFNS